MKNTDIKKYIKHLSPPYMLMAGAGLLAGVFAIREFAKLLAESPQEKTDKQIDIAIKDEQGNGNPLSFPIAQYQMMADIIEEATDTSGTDTDAVYGVFLQLKNNTDLLQLIKAYGQRWNFMFGVPLGKFSLQQIINSELDGTEKATLNQILLGKGISIQI